MQKFIVLIFFLKAFSDGSVFKSSGSSFQIFAPVKAKLILYSSVLAFGISKFRVGFLRLYTCEPYCEENISAIYDGTRPLTILYIIIAFCCFLISNSEDHPNCLRISLDRTEYGKPVITRAARFCSLWSLFDNVSLMPSQTRQQ